LNILAFSKDENQIRDSSIPEITTLLPKTVTLLSLNDRTFVPLK
jgi:hypothetical protein